MYELLCDEMCGYLQAPAYILFSLGYALDRGVECIFTFHAYIIAEGVLDVNIYNVNINLTDR